MEQITVVDKVVAGFDSVEDIEKPSPRACTFLLKYCVC